MKIIKLTAEHVDITRPMFSLKKFMGVSPEKNYFVKDDIIFEDYYHEAFYNTYLSGLNNYHAYGAFDDNNVIQGIISFYESQDEPSWYGTGIRNRGNREVAKALLDTAIKHNENNNRLKFYTVWSQKHMKMLRRFIFSDWANERYDYFDEYVVPSKHQCIYNFHWQILFNRILVPVDSVVRCTFLKQQYRNNLAVGGNL